MSRVSIRVGRGCTVVWGLTGEVSSSQHSGENGSFEFPSSIELFETFDSFLSVKCWSHSFPLTDPGMLQCICSSDPLPWIHRQHWVYQILRFRCHRVPFRRRILLWSKVKGKVWIGECWKVSKNIRKYRKGHKDCSKLQVRRLSTHIVSSCFNLCIKSMLVLIPEWRISYQKDVQDDSWKKKNSLIEFEVLEHTTSPNVDGFAIRIFLENFRW